MTSHPTAGSRTHPAAQPLASASPARRICLLGGESSGKTTLAQALAQHLQTPWVAEYGRERWLEIGGTFSLAELVSVAQVQIAREEQALPAARGWLVCDTSPLTTLCYALLDHGASQPAAPEFEALWAMARRPYDRIVLCAPDFDFVQDGARRDAGFRAEQHALTLRTLQRLALPYSLISGPLPERLAQVLALLQAGPPVSPGLPVQAAGQACSQRDAMPAASTVSP